MLFAGIDTGYCKFHTCASMNLYSRLRLIALISLIPLADISAKNIVSEINPAKAGTVSADRVNVRARASLIGERVTQLRKGDSVKVLAKVKVNPSKEGEPLEWLKIAMPPGGQTWVYMAFVKDGKITANRLNVRAGGSEQFGIVGRLAKGDFVKEKRISGDWIEVEHPDGAYAFVSAKYIKIGDDILSKEKPINTVKGFVNDTEDDQKRFIQSTFKYGNEELIVMNGYFPQGENINHETKFPKKIKYYADLKEHILNLKKVSSNLIVMGDFNVSPEDIDIGIGEQNAKRWLREGKTSFQPQEREMWNSIKDLGFVDTWRLINPDESSIYSWFDYRSRMFDQDPQRGLRIDHMMLSENLKDSINSVGIDHVARGMEKPSDHCPIWLELDE